MGYLPNDNRYHKYCELIDTKLWNLFHIFKNFIVDREGMIDGLMVNGICTIIILARVVCGQINFVEMI